jgi:hypothetical protein
LFYYIRIAKLQTMQERMPANRFENSKYIVEYFPGESTVEFLMKDKEIDAQDVIEMHKVVLSFTQMRPYATLFKAMDFFSLTTEARVEGSKKHYSAFVLVQAFVVKNLAQRLIGNFIMKFNTPVKESRLFANAEDARDWIAMRMAAQLKANRERELNLMQ